MSDNFKLGMDCKLYYKTTLLTGPPDGTGWTELDNAKDVNLQQENGEADITTRANGGWRATAATLKEATIEFEMLWKPSDAAFTAILNAWLTSGEIAIAAMDGAIETGAENAGNQGLASNCSVTSFTRNEPLEEAVTVSVTLKPSSFTAWYTVPAA
jgi:hypothetical protein